MTSAPVLFRTHRGLADTARSHLLHIGFPCQGASGRAGNRHVGLRPLPLRECENAPSAEGGSLVSEDCRPFVCRPHQNVPICSNICTGLANWLFPRTTRNLTRRGGEIRRLKRLKQRQTRQQKRHWRMTDPPMNLIRNRKRSLPKRRSWVPWTPRRRIPRRQTWNTKS